MRRRIQPPEFLPFENHKPLPLDQVVTQASTENPPQTQQVTPSQNSWMMSKQNRRVIGAMGILSLLTLISLLYQWFTNRPMEWMENETMVALLQKARPFSHGDENNKKHKSYIVFVSKYNPQITTTTNTASTQIWTSIGRGKDAFAALRRANARIPSKYQSSLKVKVDVVTSITSRPQYNFRTDIIPVSGISIPSTSSQSSWPYFGLTFMNDWKNLAFLPEQVYSHGIIQQEHQEKIHYESRSSGGGGRQGKSILRWDHLGKIWSARNHQYAPNRRPVAFPFMDRADDDYAFVGIEFFETASAFVDLSSGETYELFHGHRIYTDRDLTPTLLMNAARDAGNHLTRSIQVKNNGKFLDGYSPRSDRPLSLSRAGSHYQDDGSTTLAFQDDYDLSRHAGTVYAMSLLYKTWKDDNLLKSIKLALDYMLTHLRDCPLAYSPADDSAKCIVVNIQDGGRKKWTTLSANAMGLLALVQYMESTNDADTYIDAIQQLSIWIGGIQRDDGSFCIRQDIVSNELDETIQEPYSPAQAALALSKLQNAAVALSLQQPPEWKQVASLAMDALLAFEEAKDKDTANANDAEDKYFHNHWMLLAMAEMNVWHSNQDVIDFAARAARVAAQRQIRANPRPDLQDHVGSYRGKDNDETTDVSTSYITATHSEGLCAIYPILLQSRPEMAASALESVKWGIRYQLQTQIRSEQSMYFKVPFKIEGAFARNLVDKTTRSDFTHQNLQSILCLVRVLQARI